MHAGTKITSQHTANNKQSNNLQYIIIQQLHQAKQIKQNNWAGGDRRLSSSRESEKRSRNRDCGDGLKLRLEATLMINQDVKRQPKTEGKREAAMEWRNGGAATREIEGRRQAARHSGRELTRHRRWAAARGWLWVRWRLQRLEGRRSSGSRVFCRD